MTPKRRSSDPVIAEIKEDVKLIKTAILGDLEDKKPGILTRLALSEQSIKRLWYLVAAVTVSVGGKLVYSAIL